MEIHENKKRIKKKECRFEKKGRYGMGTGELFEKVISTFQEVIGQTWFVNEEEEKCVKVGCENRTS
jgi:hypothetical protein